MVACWCKGSGGCVACGGVSSTVSNACHGGVMDNVSSGDDDFHILSPST